MSDSTDRQSNYGLYEPLVADVRYAVKARNGSLVPCISYLKFQIIHPDLPKKLWSAQNWRACDTLSHFEGGAWRFSHGNVDGDLPEWEIDGKVYQQETSRFLGEDQHRFQQFQEFDVRAMLHITGDTASKEAADPGAMRVCVDECFEHVYFTLNHYRDIKVAKHTDLVNPWMLVLFDGLGPGFGWETDKTFAISNITEVGGHNGKVMATFGKLKCPVTLIKPKSVKRQRRSSYTFTKDTSTGPLVVGFTPPEG
jgi:hypothetical protein